MSARTRSNAISFPRRPIGPTLSRNLFRSPGLPSEVAGRTKNAVHSARNPLLRALGPRSPALPRTELPDRRPGSQPETESVLLERTSGENSASGAAPCRASRSFLTFGCIRSERGPEGVAQVVMAIGGDRDGRARPSAEGPLCWKLQTTSVSARILSATAMRGVRAQPGRPRTQWRRLRHVSFPHSAPPEAKPCSSPGPFAGSWPAHESRCARARPARIEPARNCYRLDAEALACRQPTCTSVRGDIPDAALARSTVEAPNRESTDRALTASEYVVTITRPALPE